MKDFLARAGWGDAVVTPLPGDASTRRYARLALGERKAMLMDQPQNAEAPTAGPDASEETRRALGYNGLAAPEIYDADPALGFVILEDLGDALFAEVLADGGNKRELYQHAVDVLAKIHASEAPVALAEGKPLFDYDLAALIAETDLLPEWFLLLALGRKAT
jgi:N-acetylmuramate 1-kinase